MITKRLFLILLIALSTAADAQEVHIPDPNLRAAIHEQLQRPAHLPIDRAAMLELIDLPAIDRGIKSLAGLEYAKNLVVLEGHKNPIWDLSPLAHLANLHRLYISRCNISDLTPLATLPRLEGLDLSYNRIVDVSPLAGLPQILGLELSRNKIKDVTPLANLTSLEFLHLTRNAIEDVTPLANLTSLEFLDVTRNQIEDHSALDGLLLSDLRYDQTCDMPPFPVQPRLKNRTYPSLVLAWGAHTINRPNLSPMENEALHDLWFSTPHFGLDFAEISLGFKIRGMIDEAIDARQKYLSINPNMVFLVDIRMFELWEHEAPADWPGWVRDANGARVSYWPGAYLVDFTQSHVQDRIVEQAVAVSECGLYDGIFFDHWHDYGSHLSNYLPLEEEQRARVVIMQRIRSQTRDNFLVIGNTNVRRMPITGEYVNGSFLETPVPGNLREETALYWLGRLEQSLQWLESNLREPRINVLEGRSIPTEPVDSPTNRRWMRLVTTLSLTRSDGYFLFSKFPAHSHYWYEFWDADLGQPVGAKGQLYQGTDGLYIREYTNGWAVYNHSGAAQVIRLPEEVQGVASGLVNVEHALANLDGEMYLRATPKNPADVNGDGVVNILDLTLVAQGFGTGEAGADVNGDGVVNVFDLVFVAGEIQ